MSNSTIDINSSVIGNKFKDILLCDDIEPGSEPSYEICKLIYEYHPIGKKMVDKPIEIAQSQERVINVQKGPEDILKQKFKEEWKRIGADKYIANTMRLSRIYGISAIAIKVKDQPDAGPLNFNKLHNADIAFSVFDPLNIAGSVVLNLNPNAFDFLKTKGIAVQGQPYHRDRTQIVMHEDPIYLSYTVASYGFVGRSVYQRSLYPLKSFIQSMIADDMITRKSGIIIAKMKPYGAIVNQIQNMAAGFKRQLLKEAKTDNVISINIDEAIEALDLKNVDGAFSMARKDILENIAAGDDMPAKILIDETFAEGFGEGSEDAKNIAQFVNRVRIEMNPIYEFFDKIVQYRAWNEDVYENIKANFPEIKGSYETAFNEWQESFRAEWPNLLEEPDSEKSKVEDVKLKAVVAMTEVLLPEMDPENKARVLQWACDNFNEFKLLFGTPLELDTDALADFFEEQKDNQQTVMESQLQEPKPQAPFSSKDSARTKLLALTRAK
jgi:hypothetical protein